MGQNWVFKKKLKDSVKTQIKTVEHDVWIVKCLNYSEKFGIGYELSNGIIGVFYNDLTKLCIDPNNYHLDYFEQDEMKKDKKNGFVCNTMDYPDHLPNPVT
jgi:hypothetical protein|tara:strand:- start:120 stop:422 length:303 start_codon:yes stop_codon:yes gene_type:complete